MNRVIYHALPCLSENLISEILDYLSPQRAINVELKSVVPFLTPELNKINDIQRLIAIPSRGKTYWILDECKWKNKPIDENLNKAKTSRKRKR